MVTRKGNPLKRTIGMVVFLVLAFASIVIVSLIKQNSSSPVQSENADAVSAPKPYSRRDDEAWRQRYVEPIEIPQEIRKLLAEGEPAYTNQQAQEWVDQLLPIVERVTQRSTIGNN